MQDQVSILRADLFELCVDTIFIVLGMISCGVAALRRRHHGMRAFLWMGVWSISYGLLHFLGLHAVQTALPGWLRASTPYVVTALLYAMLVFGCFAWLELTTGALRRILFGFLSASIMTAVLGISWFIITGAGNALMVLNNLLAASVLLILLVTVTNRRLFKKYLLLPARGFLVFGTFVFALEALFVNLTRHFLSLSTPVWCDHLGFLALITALGYSAMKMVQLNEHRLLELHAELEIARQIQASILPTSVPSIAGLRISATYRPMASVAGDFYEFLLVDDKHAGFFIADVCGHGVPAALIASMLNIAVRSVATCADRPAAFLHALNRVLAEPLRGQLVSAAYLWVDLNSRQARYSAAGHPPLLCCNHRMERIQSNGLLFGILPEVEYPERAFPLSSGDRLLLYTDGLTEAENASGEAFGDVRMQEVVASTRSYAGDAFSQRLVSEIQSWQRTPEPQDDLTFVVIDVC